MDKKLFAFALAALLALSSVRAQDNPSPEDAARSEEQRSCTGRVNREGSPKLRLYENGNWSVADDRGSWSIRGNAADVGNGWRRWDGNWWYWNWFIFQRQGQGHFICRLS